MIFKVDSFTVRLSIDLDGNGFVCVSYFLFQLFAIYVVACCDTVLPSFLNAPNDDYILFCFQSKDDVSVTPATVEQATDAAIAANKLVATEGLTDVTINKAIVEELVKKCNTPVTKEEPAETILAVATTQPVAEVRSAVAEPDLAQVTLSEEPKAAELKAFGTSLPNESDEEEPKEVEKVDEPNTKVTKT